jgi:predicted RNA binding protein YcfA (HicA-like mRNA interferase family)
VVRALLSYGYVVVRQRGSHVRLRHPAGQRVPLTVPVHREIKRGVLRSLIRDARITDHEFLRALG